MSPIRIVVLAAGRGTRMKSALPKVLHRLAGRPLLLHALGTAASLKPVGITVVVGHGSDAVRDTVEAGFDAATSRSGPISIPITWAEQAEQLGTGHAVRQALPSIDDGDTVLITYGDVPLTRPETFEALIDTVDADTIGLLTLLMVDPTGYGRILREGGRADGAITGIVEQKDATPEQLEIREGNAGVIAIRGDRLADLLSRIDNRNAQGEFYLTDIIGLAVGDGLRVQAVHPGSAHEVDGVNSRQQLARLERLHQREVAEALMAAGVTLADPARLDVRGHLETGTDCTIDVNCVFEGRCTLGANVSIGPNCTIRDSHLGDGTTVHANSVIEASEVGENGTVGPFARLRPGTRLARAVRIGNFVETKNARLGEGSKINHLSYVGDAIVGRDVNIGAGTITCNYDGANKHLTTIDDGVFVGSNTALVAPVTLGVGATIGAGSTIGRDVAPGALALTRARQNTIDGWQRPTKKASS